jgi:hypothetical protein
MATEWKSQQADGMFYLQFETDNKGKYMLVEKAAQMAIDGKTTADYAEVKHGEWVEIAENSTGKLIYCTNCNEPINPNKKDVELHRTKEKPDYCPNCGAKMDGNNLPTITTGSEGSDT